MGIAQICLCTGNLATLLVQLIQGFITLDGAVQLAYLVDQGTLKHVCQEFFYITNVRPPIQSSSLN